MELLDLYVGMAPKAKLRLARALGISPAYLRHLAHRHRLPSPVLAQKISAHTGVPIERLRPDLARIFRS